MANIITYDETLLSLQFSEQKEVDEYFLSKVLNKLLHHNETADFFARKNVNSKPFNGDYLTSINSYNNSFNSNGNFGFSASTRSVDILRISRFISNIWFEYEQFSIFLTNDKCIDYDFVRSNNWKHIINKYKSCLLFKSIEENVVWFAQSNGLFFDEIWKDEYDIAFKIL